MKAILALSLALFVAPLSSGLAQQQPAAPAFLQKSLTGYIQPGYDAFSNATSKLASGLKELCQSPSGEKLQTSRAQFRTAAQLWARMEWLRVGPVMENNRLERILFYPDRKSTGLRQVQRALGKSDPTTTSQATLAKKSVAMQGLGALEFLLFGTGSEDLLDPTSTYRCEYAQAVGDNLVEIADTFTTRWKIDTDLTSAWLSPKPTNPLYRNNREALTGVLGTIVHGLEAIRDVRIGAFLREPPKQDRPKSALLWRSQSTMPMIEQNLRGLRDLYLATGLRENLTGDAAAFSDSLLFEFDLTIQVADAFDAPIAELLADDNTREKLRFLQLSVRFLVQRLDTEFLPALGLQSGFSFGDGD
ncbi:MAG: peptidase M75, Imelysin [Rhizobiaceae bacterium]|nr:peptidase M75, Imelysin [Rhizobiaceae bacterium]